MTPSRSSKEPRKVILITGASSGIGKACAKHLAAKGYGVFGAQRHVPEGKPQADGVESITMDVDDDDSVNKKLEPRFVTAGMTNGRVTAISEGDLHEGEVVVIGQNDGGTRAL